MPYIKVYLHFVWSTKHRFPFLETPEIRKTLWKHIYHYGKNKNLFIDMVNGYKEHCHCLVSLGVDQTIKQVIQLIKGESSHWLNHNHEGISLKKKFGWQMEYFVASVSESQIEKVRSYIKKQEEHHMTKSYEEEYREFSKLHGFRVLRNGKLR